MEELLDIEPSDDDEMHPLQFKKKVFDTPFFQMSTGEIQKASIFSNRLRELGYRAGYVRPPTIHDFRAEGSYLIGMLLLYSGLLYILCGTNVL